MYLSQYTESLDSLREALQISQEIGSHENKAGALGRLAELHQELGEVELAREYAQRGLKLATELNLGSKSDYEELLAELETCDE